MGQFSRVPGPRAGPEPVPGTFLKLAAIRDRISARQGAQSPRAVGPGRDERFCLFARLLRVRERSCA